MVLAFSMCTAHFICFFEIHKCCLNKCSFALLSIWTSSKQYTRDTISTILLSTICQPLVSFKVSMPEAFWLFPWKLEITIRGIIMIEVVLLTLSQTTSLCHISYIFCYSRLRVLFSLSSWKVLRRRCLKRIRKFIQIIWQVWARDLSDVSYSCRHSCKRLKSFSLRDTAVMLILLFKCNRQLSTST